MFVHVYVCVQNNHKMKITRSSWSSAMFKFMLAAVLPVQVSMYKILLIPLPGKSHVFSMTAMAEGLANRGHKVTFFVGESYQLNLPELTNRTELSVARFKDATQGACMDYVAADEDIAKSAIESGGSIKDLMSILNKLYVDSTC